MNQYLHVKSIQRKNWVGLKDSTDGQDDDSLVRTGFYWVDRLIFFVVEVEP